MGRIGHLRASAVATRSRGAWRGRFALAASARMGDSAHKPLRKDAARPSRVRKRIQRKQRGSRRSGSSAAR